MKVYIDDMLVKNIESDRYITNLEEVFEELRKYQMKHNPNKFTFGVISKNFWIFI